MREKKDWGLMIAGVTALATVGGWLFPGGIRPFFTAPKGSPVQESIRSQRLTPPEPEVKHQNQLTEVHSQTNTPSLKLSPPDDGEATSATRHWKNQTFTLIDQEQRAIVPGCASLAVEFQEVAGVDFVTIRINAGDESTSHAVSQAGEQFRLPCGDRDYRVSILLVDRAAGTVRVGVEKITS